MRKPVLALILISIIFSSIVFSQAEDETLKQGLGYLKSRKDNQALWEFDKVLNQQPDNPMALWGKAEVFRRARKFKEAEEILNKVLSKFKNYPSCLISLSYIRYYEGKRAAALKLLKRVLSQPKLDKENKAIAYMLIGSIHANLAGKGGLLSKITYGTRIGGNFEKAKRLAPELSEVRMALGTFYLLAPKIIGGNLDKAQEELECAVKLTPDFATANARLAQVYKLKNDLENYEFYFRRAEELDSENEVLKELAESK